MIPYHVQYWLDVQDAVERIHFDAVDDYSRHVRIVVTAERGGLRLFRGVAFLGVAIHWQLSFLGSRVAPEPSECTPGRSRCTRLRGPTRGRLASVVARLGHE